MWGISVNCLYTKLNGAVNFRSGRGLRFAACADVQAQLLKRKDLLVFLSYKDELDFCHLCKNLIMKICCQSAPLHLLVVLTLLSWRIENASTSELPDHVHDNSSECRGILAVKKTFKKGVRSCSVTSSIVSFAAWNALSLNQKLYPTFILFWVGIIVCHDNHNG